MFYYYIKIAFKNLWKIFAVSGLSALLLAWGMVGWQSLRAALRNPVEALRYE